MKTRVRKRRNKAILFQLPIYAYRRLERVRDALEKTQRRRGSATRVSIRSLVRLALADFLLSHEKKQGKD